MMIEVCDFLCERFCEGRFGHAHKHKAMMITNMDALFEG